MFSCLLNALNLYKVFDLIFMPLQSIRSDFLHQILYYNIHLLLFLWHSEYGKESRCRSIQGK